MAKHDLTSPLLPFQPSKQPELVLTVDENPGCESAHQRISNRNNNHHGNNHTHVEFCNPFAFLGAGDFAVPAATTLDPFRNHTVKIEGVYEWVKIAVCLPVALVRLVIFGVCLLVGFVATKLALQGWKDKHNPMPRWRCNVMWVTRLCTRCILFAFGYHWIKRKGRPAPREIAPIVVSNHVSYIEPIFFFYELFPTIVASESHDSLPFVGTIIRAMQVIYVNRFLPSSRKHAVQEIKRKASCDRYPRVLLFPEGTTTNGRVLISFQLGAFIHGYPIQPVIVRYPHVHFDQSWGHISLAKLMFRMFTQFHNFMEVEYLPVISPLENRKENAVHFAERTSHAIAAALNVVQTSHSYGDLMLLTRASQSKQEKVSNYMVEMAKMEAYVLNANGDEQIIVISPLVSDTVVSRRAEEEHVFNLGLILESTRSFQMSTMEAVEFLDKFLSMNPDPSGCVKIHDFLKVLRLKACTLSEKIFGFVDVEKNGKITFRQFLFGSANVMKQPLFRQACELAFADCDTSGNNYVSEGELGDSIRPAIPDLNEDEIHELFNLLDTDSDGRVSKDDFITGLRKNPLLIALFSPRLLQKDFNSAGDRILEEIV